MTPKVWHEAVTPSLREKAELVLAKWNRRPFTNNMSRLFPGKRTLSLFLTTHTPATYATHICACCDSCHWCRPVQLELFSHVYFTPFSRTPILVWLIKVCFKYNIVLYIRMFTAWSSLLQHLSLFYKLRFLKAVKQVWMIIRPEVKAEWPFLLDCSRVALLIVSQHHLWFLFFYKAEEHIHHQLVHLSNLHLTESSFVTVAWSHKHASEPVSAFWFWLADDGHGRRFKAEIL